MHCPSAKMKPAFPVHIASPKLSANQHGSNRGLPEIALPSLINLGQPGFLPRRATMAVRRRQLVVALVCFLTLSAKAQEDDERTTQLPTTQTPQVQPPVRICVVAKLADWCSQMQQDLPDRFTCVIGRDSVDCADKIQQGKADISNMDPQSLYIAGEYFGIAPLARELVEGAPYRYQGIALVRSDANISSLGDLKGKRSCHTGVGRTVGWQIPIGILLSRGVMTADCKGELHTVESFFNGSCAAGSWSADPTVDSELKKRHPSLCSQCKDPSTCTKDAYSGYQGAISCLLQDAGDVAFTKVPALRDFLDKDPGASQHMQLLCLNGSKQSVLDEKPCVWSHRPSNAFVISSSLPEDDRERFLRILIDTMNLYPPAHVRRPDWLYKSFYSSNTVTGLQAVPAETKTWKTYLGDFIYAIRKTKAFCDYKPLKFCVTSEQEKEKCVDYSRAVDGRGLIPPVECVLTSSKLACMEAVKQGNADIVTLDGGDVYKAGKYYDLQPISAELYGDSDAIYYAVAVVRSASDVEKLSQLRGLRSCHTGIGRTAGWVVPVGALIDLELIPRNPCNRAKGVADFFASSCVPGANDTKYNPGRVRADDLCRRCIGDENGEAKCARDSRERYSGYAGALRCLAEGAGDVAFVKHTTVAQYSDGKGDALWAKDLLSSDFQLLCRKGGRSQINEYQQCNLAKVPSHYVMTGGNASTEQRLEIAALLAQSAKYFSDDSVTFTLFENYKGQPDLLFKDSTTALKASQLTDSYIDALGNEFYKASADADPKNCEIS